MVVYLNGKFLDARAAKISPFDPGFLFGDGIFETIRTHNNELMRIDEHLARLYESARMRGWKLSFSSDELKKILKKTVAKNIYNDARVRILFTPGLKQPTLFIWVQPLEKLPDSVYARGVSVITFPLERPFPQMKTTSMQPLLIAREEMTRKKAFEVFLINRRGHVTEGTWSNIFIVKKKLLITPRLGVLLGTTRGHILKRARKLFRIKQRDITRRELMNADECFFTNAAKKIVPVVKVDGEKIGTGKVGPVTKHLMENF